MKTTENKRKCYNILTKDERHEKLCHNYFSTNEVELIIDNSDYVIFHHSKLVPDMIIAFSLLKCTEKNVIEISLLCAVLNQNQDESTMIQSVLQFAAKKRRNILYTAPRALNLRNSYMKFGFEHHFGIQGLNEVLKRIIDNRVCGRTCKKRIKHKHYTRKQLTSV